MSRDDKKVFLDLIFLDSFQFLQGATVKLAKSLTGDETNEVRRYFSDKVKFSETWRKGISPYSYVNSEERLCKTSLPRKVFLISYGKKV